MLIVAALYHFSPLEDPAALCGPLAAVCRRSGIKGSLLVAGEGVNGTIAGSRDGIDTVLAHLRDWPGCAGLEWKESSAETMPFGRMKVKLKREIVTMGVPGIDPRAAVGHYVEPKDWNALIAAPDVAVIDTRNAYEVRLGRFAGAVDPDTAAFREFPGWWQAQAARFAGKRIAMYCTGGIRCEKSTNFLISQGVTDVFHLKGGILKYLEEVPADQSLWQGECYVFDGRVSVSHGLKPGNSTSCGACRRPVTQAEQAHADYEEGVCCPACVREYSESDRNRFRERQRQIELARLRGTVHLGAMPEDP